MDFGRIVKWVLILGVIFFIWKYVIPYANSPITSTVPGAGADTPCVQAAAQASESWGSGLGRFVNPPHDNTAWSVFRGTVEGRIGAAERACGCVARSCEMARKAMSDLRGIVSDVDSAFRSNTGPPEDIVRRQESVDTQIDLARQVALSGN